jgi:hypothetical protein
MLVLGRAAKQRLLGKYLSLMDSDDGHLLTIVRLRKARISFTVAGWEGLTAMEFKKAGYLRLVYATRTAHVFSGSGGR